MVEIQGIYAALVTPFREEAVDIPALDRLVEHLLEKGVEGFYVCGSSGESLLLSPEERKLVLEAVVRRAAGRAPVIAHVGCVGTRETLDLARHAAAQGVRAVSAIPPIYFGYTLEEITSFYKEVAEAAGLPLILYNIPHMTGFTFTADNVGPLFEHPLIAGMKNTCGDLHQMRRIIAGHPDKVIISGFDELLLPSMAVGSRCAVGSNVNIMPEKFLALREAFLRGDMEEAGRKQDKINNVCATLSTVGIFRGIKGILELQGIPCGSCRKPFSPLREEEWEVLRGILPML